MRPNPTQPRLLHTIPTIPRKSFLGRKSKRASNMHVSECYLTSRLHKDHIDTLLGYLEEVCFAVGDVVAAEGEVDDALFIIK